MKEINRWDFLETMSSDEQQYIKVGIQDVIRIWNIKSSIICDFLVNAIE